jgi:hypothetical protein
MLDRTRADCRAYPNKPGTGNRKPENAQTGRLDGSLIVPVPVSGFLFPVLGAADLAARLSCFSFLT